jgi:hypothetical protein
MTLAAGDLTTQERVQTWMATGPAVPSPIIAQLITSMTALIYSKLNRARVYSRTFIRTFDGVGNMQLVLPDYPVTSVIAVQQGQVVIPPSVQPMPNQLQPQGTWLGYGYRLIPWDGNLPGENAVLEYVGGTFYVAPQNVKVTYQAGYLISQEPWTIPSATPWRVTVLQEQGIWSRDNGVAYTDGTLLTPVAASPGIGQYIPPPDATPGVYTFSEADTDANVLISYSFIPAALEEATIQMVAERYSYRSRVGEISKSLGGQETVRFMRGNSGRPWSSTSSLPPEVMDMIWPYVSVVYPNVGAPL